MASTSDLAPSRAKRQGAAATATSEATSAVEKTREEELEAQVAQLQTDLKAIASTLASLTSDKVSEVKQAATGELRELRRQGRHVVEDVQDQAGEYERQLKDTIREKPLTAVASALGIGFILALLTR